MNDEPKVMFRSIRSSKRQATLTNGSPISMLGLTFTVFEGSDDRIAEFPTMWMSLETAEALADAVRVAIQREFPAHQSKPPEETGPAGSVQ